MRFGWFIAVYFAIRLGHSFQNYRNWKLVAVRLIDSHFNNQIRYVKFQIIKLALSLLVADLELALIQYLHYDLIFCQVSEGVLHVLLFGEFPFSDITENLVYLEHLA